MALLAASASVRASRRRSSDGGDRVDDPTQLRVVPRGTLPGRDRQLASEHAPLARELHALPQRVLVEEDVGQRRALHRPQGLLRGRVPDDRRPVEPVQRDELVAVPQRLHEARLVRAQRVVLDGVRLDEHRQARARAVVDADPGAAAPRRHGASAFGVERPALLHRLARFEPSAVVLEAASHALAHRVLRLARPEVLHRVGREEAQRSRVRPERGAPVEVEDPHGASEEVQRVQVARREDSRRHPSPHTAAFVPGQ